jgi:hypothetical protein
MQNFFFQGVLVGLIGFLSIVYLCFVGVWNWVCFFIISLLILYEFVLGGRMISIPFSSSHPSNWCCFCPWSVCNLVLANLQSKTNKTKKARKKKEKKTKGINRERWWTNKQGRKQTNPFKKFWFRNSRISVLLALVLFHQHPLLMLIFKQNLGLSLTRWQGSLTRIFSCLSVAAAPSMTCALSPGSRDHPKLNQEYKIT